MIKIKWSTYKKILCIADTIPLLNSRYFCNALDLQRYCEKYHYFVRYKRDLYKM